MKKEITKRIVAAALAVTAAFSAASISGSARTMLIKGDCDADGVFTSNDAVTVLRRSLDDSDPSNTTLARMDADGDETITSNDAILVLRESVGFGAISQGEGAEEHVYDTNDGMNSFSSELFKRIIADPDNKDENTLVSPLSAYIALSMLSNGSANETKWEHARTQEEMLRLLGGGNISQDDINRYINGYMSQVNNGGYMKIANSMFVIDRDDVILKPDFINTLRNDYFAEIFNGPANDSTVEAINNWADENTDHMINKVLEYGSLTPESLAVLLNAVCFDAKWEDLYKEDDIRKYTFTNSDGSTINRDFLCSTEDIYLCDDKAEGVMKYYDTWHEGTTQERYAFIGILPKEGVTVDEYVASMTPSTIYDLVETRNSWSEVYTHIPKFEYDCYYDLNKPLEDMGMTSAFNRRAADFSELAECQYEDYNVFVNRVFQKTHIELDENGTKAAAVTVIDICVDACAEPDEVHYIYLDRPFIYCIYDVKNNVPVFLGTVNNLN